MDCAENYEDYEKPESLPSPEKIEDGKTYNISENDFREKMENFGSTLTPEPKTESWEQGKEHPIQYAKKGIEHIANDPKGWAEGEARELYCESKGAKVENWEGTGKHIGLEGVESAEDVFDKHYAPEKGHFGIDVDIEAKNAEIADQKAKAMLEDLDFKSDNRPGYSWGSEQYWRDDLEGNQEHLRYYGVQEVDDGHYRAIFIGEK